MTERPRLHLTLLGGFQARVSPGGVLSLPTRKSQALLAYLGLPLGRPHPRDTLASLLWGGIREKSARASLRQALFAIRKALGGAEHSVKQEGDALALDPVIVDVDAVTFQRAVAEGTPQALERADALYRGDLLSGFAVDEPPFEEWLLGERERLRELALEALARLLAHQRKAGATEPAIQTALRLLTLDSLQEPVHRTLMRLYAELGRREAGLRQYQHCVGVLQRELGIEPEAVTYLKVAGAWRYLAVVMDRYSRRIIGWSLGPTKDARLTLRALNHAVGHRGPRSGVIFHSDRGVEYAAYAFRNRLAALGFVQSMNRPREITDNAHMESFFHSMKSDVVHGVRFAEHAELVRLLRGYIPYYNRVRMHTGIGYSSPVDYEAQAT